MPSLFRFLIVVGVLAGLAYAGMWALVTFVEPQQREMSRSLPPNALVGK
ncbi:MAG: histidine kinase [Rhodoblastus sp.]